MAFVKIGAYGPGAAWIDIHMPPEQAVQVHRDVRARRMFPVHWSTFNLAYHDWDEPIRRAAAEARRTGVELVTPRLGEWVDADREFRSAPWWRRCAEAARSDAAHALRGTAAAAQPSFVMRLAVADGDFLAGLDAAHRVELDAPLADAQHRIRPARVVWV
jgi:hypothetical protein